MAKLNAANAANVAAQLTTATIATLAARGQALGPIDSVAADAVFALYEAMVERVLAHEIGKLDGSAFA